MKKVKNRTQVMQILEALRCSRKGLTMRMIWAEVDIDSLESLKVTASLLKSKGLIKTDDNLICHTCYAEDICYRITDDGRIYLRYKSMGEA